MCKIPPSLQQYLSSEIFNRAGNRRPPRRKNRSAQHEKWKRRGVRLLFGGDISFLRIPQRIFDLWNFCVVWQNVFLCREISALSGKTWFLVMKLFHALPNAFSIHEIFALCGKACFLLMKLFHALPNTFSAYEISALPGKTYFLLMKLFHDFPNTFSAYELSALSSQRIFDSCVNIYVSSWLPESRTICALR